MTLDNRHKLIKKVKKATIYLVAVLLVLYVLADVSVLQIIHGSENVGIPASHHSIDEDGCLDRDPQSNSTQSTQANLSKTDEHHNSDEDCSDEGECFASCSHIVVSYFSFNSSPLSEIRTGQSIVHYENRKPKSDPSDIFHPPQTA